MARQDAGYSVTQSVYYTTLISLAGVPGFFTAAYLIEAWGRKPACVAALVGAAVSAWFYGTAANEASRSEPAELIVVLLGTETRGKTLEMISA